MQVQPSPSLVEMLSLCSPGTELWPCSVGLSGQKERAESSKYPALCRGHQGLVPALAAFAIDFSLETGFKQEPYWGLESVPTYDGPFWELLVRLFKY